MSRPMRFALPVLMLLVLTGLSLPARSAPQLPDFTYQGRLTQNGAPANGSFNFAFQLFDDPVVGIQVGPTLTELNYPVADGLFTVALAFPGAFNGTQMWLQVTVNGQPLTPRQAVSTAPVAQFALSGTISGPAGGALTGSYPNPGIATNAVGAAQLATDSVGATEIADNSIDGGEIIDNSLGGGEILDGSLLAADIATGAIGAAEIATNAVGAAELADGAVDTAALLNDSVTMAKTAGGGATGNISLNVPAQTCVDVTVAVNGSLPGDYAIFSWANGASVPVNIVVTAMRVDTANQVILRACNHGNSAAAVNTQPVRVRTFR